MKILALISSHSHPIFTKMTVATLKREIRGHDLQIHIGYHSNLSDYTDDFSMFQDLERHCHFHAVDEIDWGKDPSDIYRYSRMHAKNLENLFKNVKYFDFDYIAILDNDLYIKQDFISDLINRFPDSDVIGTYFTDVDHQTEIRDQWDNDTKFAPKLSVWNLLISRKLFNRIITNTGLIYPNFYDGVFYDTFARVLHEVNTTGEFKLGIIPTSRMSEMVDHFFYSSFNYGQTMNGGGPSGETPFKIWEGEFGNNFKSYIDSI